MCASASLIHQPRIWNPTSRTDSHQPITDGVCVHPISHLALSRASGFVRKSQYEKAHTSARTSPRTARTTIAHIDHLPPPPLPRGTCLIHPSDFAPRYSETPAFNANAPSLRQTDTSRNAEATRRRPSTYLQIFRDHRNLPRPQLLNLRGFRPLSLPLSLSHNFFLSASLRLLHRRHRLCCCRPRCVSQSNQKSSTRKKPLAEKKKPFLPSIIHCRVWISQTRTLSTPSHDTRPPCVNPISTRIEGVITVLLLRYHHPPSTATTNSRYVRRHHACCASLVGPCPTKYHLVLCDTDPFDSIVPDQRYTAWVLTKSISIATYA